MVEEYILSSENSCSFDGEVNTMEALKTVLSPGYNSAEFDAVCSAKLPTICPEKLKITIYLDENDTLESIDVSFTGEQ